MLLAHWQDVARGGDAISDGACRHERVQLGVLRGAVGLQRLHRVGQRLGDDARQEPLEVQRLAHDVAASRAVAGPGGRRVGRDSHVKDCV